MKANEFVRNYGASRAKNELSMFEPQLSECFGDKFVSEIKRLIESHEVVDKCGGLNSLKAWTKETKSKLSIATYFHCNKPHILIQIENAEKAIADVESCM